jgi:hypothetical protein
VSEIHRTRAEAFELSQGYGPNYTPLNVTRVRASDDGLYRVVMARVAELADQGVPEFAERLRLAENEAEDWLCEHGWPEPDYPSDDNDEAWERWMDVRDFGYDSTEDYR